MSRPIRFYSNAFLAAAFFSALTPVHAFAQSPDRLAPPGRRVAPPVQGRDQRPVRQASLNAPVQQQAPPTAEDAIRMVEATHAALQQVRDYSCTLVKRERINGRLTTSERMAIKLRHEPFSVYVNYLAPDRLRGQEGLYVHGHNDNLLLAHPNGLKGRLVGTFRLDPVGKWAMEGNRYPVTDLGLKRMAESWLKESKHDLQFVRCSVRIAAGAKIEGRPCTCIELVRQTRHDDVPFQLTRLYIDAQLRLPVRYEAYEWPAQHGGEPVLAEEYTYLDVSPNRQFADFDFDVQNPEYNFK